MRPMSATNRISLKMVPSWKILSEFVQNYQSAFMTFEKKLSPVILVALITHHTPDLPSCYDISCHVAMWDFLRAGISYTAMSLIHWDETKPCVKNTVYWGLFLQHASNEKYQNPALPHKLRQRVHEPHFSFKVENATALLQFLLLIPDTPVCCASQTNPFLGNVTNRAPISSSLFPR